MPPKEGPADGSGAMFDTIAPRYDLLNTCMSFGLDRLWRRCLVRALKLGAMPEGARVLDVATGTGDVALAIHRARPDLRVTGLDPSTGMLALAAQKAAQRAPDAPLTWQPGDAQALPFDDGTFAAACISFGIRNVPDRKRGLEEMARVVTPGGVVAVLELGEPRQGPLQRLARWHVHTFVPWLGRRLVGGQAYSYLERSIAAFPEPETFARIMADAGLGNVQVARLSFGAVHLYTGTAR